MFSTQDAYADPDCSKSTISFDDMYIASKDKFLAILEVSSGIWCKVGNFLEGSTLRDLTDIALDSTGVGLDPLYGLGFDTTGNSKLWLIDRGTGALTLVGPLRDCTGSGNIIKSINALDIDTGGIAYAAGHDGRLWNVDLTDGCVVFRALLVDPLAPGKGLNIAGDLAWDLNDGNMFVTAKDCSKLHRPAAPGVPHGGHADTCANGDDGLYKIMVIDASFDTVFIGTLGFPNVFAMDLLAFSDTLCAVTRGGTLLEVTKWGAPVKDMPTDILGAATTLLFANGGTALQQLVGGLLIPIEKAQLLLDLIPFDSLWQLIPFSFVDSGVGSYYHN